MTVEATVSNPVAEKLAAWPDVLRSGEYQQTTGFMKDDVGYCCIGVLNEMVFNARFWKLNPDSIFYIDEEGQAAQLFRTKAEKVGLHKEITQDEIDYLVDYFEDVELEEQLSDLRPGSWRQATLTTLNDRGATFEQIADVVEALNWHKIDTEG